MSGNNAHVLVTLKSLYVRTSSRIPKRPRTKRRTQTKNQELLNTVERTKFSYRGLGLQLASLNKWNCNAHKVADRSQDEINWCRKCAVQFRLIRSIMHQSRIIFGWFFCDTQQNIEMLTKELTFKDIIDFKRWKYFNDFN